MTTLAVVLLFALNAVITGSDSDPAVILQDISAYLPGTGEIEGWQPIGDARTFVGEDLYSLINGGAVLFYEYGFKQVITQDYANDDGKPISLEIYQMNSPASAYGIYSIKRSDGGKGIEIGDEGMLADYYLYLWKADYLVTLTTSDAEETTRSGLVAIARAVDNKILSKGQRPSLCDLLSIEGHEIRNITYLRGNLALSNNLPFVADDVFKLQEGAIGDYGDFKMYVFKYGNRNESLNRYKEARVFFRNSAYFIDFTDHEDRCTMIDTQGRAIQMERYENYIIIIMSTLEIDTGSILERLQHNITEYLDI